MTCDEQIKKSVLGAILSEKYLMHNRSTNLCDEFVQSYAWESYVNKKGLASHPGQPLLLKCELKTDGD